MRPSQFVLLELKRLSRNRFALLAAFVLILLPLLYSFLYLYAFWDPYEHLERMHVAIVNQDVPVTEEGRTVDVGNELVEKLKEDDSVSWEFTTQEDALAGLNSSQYDLAIIIPKDFSQIILDTTKDSKSGQVVPKAKLRYYSNPSKNYLAEQIGNKVASKLQGDLNGQIVGNFFENVFSSLEDMKSNLQKAADGSGELSDGIKEAYSGSAEITKNLQEAATGSNSLSQGLTNLADGTADLVQGNKQLLDGSLQLLDGSKNLHQGVGSALDGSVELSGGSNELVQGLNDANQSIKDAAIGSVELYQGLSSASAGAADLKDGLNEALLGSAQVKGGAVQIHDGLVQMQSKLNDPMQGVPALVAGTNRVVQSTADDGSLVQGILGAHQALNGQILPGLQNARNGLSEVNPVLQATNESLAKALADLEGLNSTDPQVLGAIEQLKRAQANVNPSDGTIQQIITGVDSGLESVSEGVSAVDQGLYKAQDDLNNPTSIWGGIRTLNLGANTIYQGLQQLLVNSNEAFGQLIPGSAQLKEGATDLYSGLGSAYEGSAALNDGLRDLKDGAAELSAGLASGASEFPKLVDGGKALHDGINQLKQGLSDLNGGMATFTGKLGDWVSGAEKVTVGSQALQSGAKDAVQGSQTLSDGLVALHEGSLSLTTGLGEAENGSQDLLQGLRDGVEKIQKELPENRSSVSQAMGQPVEVDETQIHPVKNYGTGFTPYFVPLSLWVGALMLFFLVNLKENSLRASGVSQVNILFSKYLTLALLGTAQAVVSSFILITVLGLQPENIFAFYGFNILQSLTYIAIIFLLVEFFDLAGRFIAIVLLMLQLTSGGGTYPISLIPKFFQAIHPYLPMTYGISALRQIISGSSEIPLQTSILILIGFGIGALALTLLLTPKRIRIKDLHHTPQLGA